jgi:hypothetical protein
MQTIVFLKGDERLLKLERLTVDLNAGLGAFVCISGRIEAGVSERARLHHEVEHGLDARHAELLRDGSDPSKVSPPQHHLQHAVRVHGELRAADFAR